MLIINAVNTTNTLPSLKKVIDVVSKTTLMIIISGRIASKTAPGFKMVPLRRSMRAQTVKNAASSSDIHTTEHETETTSMTLITKLAPEENITSLKRTINPSK